MKQVAVMAVLGAMAVVAATGFLQAGRERAALLEQSRVQHEEVTRRLERLERLVSASLDRDESGRSLASQGSAASSAKSRQAVSEEREKPGSLARQPPDHAERIQAGNEVVDRALQVGSWGPADIAAFGAATAGLTGEEREEILLRMTAAINANQVRFDPRRPGT